MPLLVPSASEVLMLQKILNQNLTLKLYSNNKIPASTDTAANYVEVSGGGYASKSLTFANWNITEGDPSVAVYNAFQDFNFTDVTGAPGTIYGYFVLDASGLLLWAERFPAEDLPFSPINGSLVRVTPRFTLDNA